MAEHHFNRYEHAAGARVAARCVCGWRSEFVLTKEQASAMLEDHLEVVRQFDGADADRA